MKKYKKGQILTYHDTGEISKVRVIEDNSTPEETRIELEIVEVLRPSGIVSESKPGEKFIASRDEKIGCAYCGWFIEENLEEDNEQANRI